MRFMKCMDCNHKYCEFCHTGEQYQQREIYPITNFDRIKAMTVEEMAEVICECMDRCIDDLIGYEAVLDWLKDEV